MDIHSRRRLLKALAGTGAVGLAGCLGEDDDPADTTPADDSDDTAPADDADDTEPPEEYSWPPPRNLIELANDSEPGGLIDMLARLWQPYFQECVEGDVSLAVSNEPQAGGVIMSNRMYNEEGHGGSMGSMRLISMIVNEIGRSDANYNTLDFRHVVRFSADTRALQMNPMTTPVEDHFDITWAEFQDFVEDSSDPLIQPVPNPAHTMLAAYLYGHDPVIDFENDIEIVVVSGGSEARSAFAREDADLYFGSFVSNITTRNDFYYTQFVMVDPVNDPGFYESVKDVTPEFSPAYGDNPQEKALVNYEDQAIIVNIDDYPQEQAETVVGLVADHHLAFLPPATPDEIYEIHAEGWQCAAESDDLADDVAGTFAEPDHNPLAGDDVQQVVEEKYALLFEDDEIRSMIEEELF